MKRIFSFLIVAIIALSFSFYIHAQTHYSSQVSIGVKGGIDFSKIFFNPHVNQKMALGTNIGFTFRYVEEKHFGLIAELNFEQRGWKENFKNLPYSYRRILNYIQIPVLAHIFFGSQHTRFFFNVGPEVGFFIGESASSNFNAENIASIPGFPLHNRVNDQLLLPTNHTVDYGISAGIGTEISIEKKHAISIESRFYYGLGNVLKSGRTEKFSASNSMSIMVSAGYWFRLK